MPATVRRWLPWAVLGVLVVVVLVVASRPDDADTPEDRVHDLAARLACPVCDGEAVADSTSVVSLQIRADLAERVAAGQSDEEILAAYADQYGDDVLLRPKAEGIGLLVYALPVMVVLGGALGLALALRRWRREPAHVPTPDDLALVERERTVSRTDHGVPGSDPGGPGS